MDSPVQHTHTLLYFSICLLWTASLFPMEKLNKRLSDLGKFIILFGPGDVCFCVPNAFSSPTQIFQNWRVFQIFKILCEPCLWSTHHLFISDCNTIYGPVEHIPSVASKILYGHVEHLLLLTAHMACYTWHHLWLYGTLATPDNTWRYETPPVTPHLCGTDITCYTW